MWAPLSKNWSRLWNGGDGGDDSKAASNKLLSFNLTRNCAYWPKPGSLKTDTEKQEEIQEKTRDEGPG